MKPVTKIKLNSRTNAPITHLEIRRESSMVNIVANKIEMLRLLGRDSGPILLSNGCVFAVIDLLAQELPSINRRHR